MALCAGLSRTALKTLRVTPVSSISCRYRGRWEEPYLRDLWNRRQLLGEDPVLPRSSQPNWNYDSELFAFGKRLGENFDKHTLRTAFVHRSYYHRKDQLSRRPLDGQNREIQSDNSTLREKGFEIAENYISAFLRYNLPQLPEEGIWSISHYLMEIPVMSYIGRHLGITDLVLAKEFPVEDETIYDTFLAIIGALESDQGLTAAEKLVQDFVLTHLIGVDLNHVYHPINPAGLLAALCEHSQLAAPEARILRTDGLHTTTPVYIVGIYQDETLIGESPGETLEIAEEMACRDALAERWRSKSHHFSWHFDSDAQTNVDVYKQRTNASLEDVCRSVDDMSLLQCRPLPLFQTEEGEEEEQEEVFDTAQMYDHFKENVEPEVGTVLRKRLRHAFSRGSISKLTMKGLIVPKANTV